VDTLLIWYQVSGSSGVEFVFSLEARKRTAMKAIP
jgi:hypothetical protein